MMDRNVSRIIVCLILIFSFTPGVYAQSDTVIFNNDNIINGDFESMERGVLSFETPYSDSDFKIEWEGIRYISIDKLLLISLRTGRFYVGNLRTDSDSTVLILTESGIPVMTIMDDIVEVQKVEEQFVDRIDFSIDFGSSITKANDLRQFTIGSGLGYYAKKWQFNAAVSTLQSYQEGLEDIRRTDGSVNFYYYLPRNYFAVYSMTFLSNTEQKLDLRTNAKLGFGKWLFRSNHSYLSLRGGFNRNLEEFSNETPDRRSWELYAGSEVNLYDIGDLDLLSNVLVYPSLTERNRWRVDYAFIAKYELPFDLYFKVDFTINFDSEPAENASRSDYVIKSSIGWEW